MDVVLGGLPDCALAIHIEQQCNSDAIGIESNGPIGFLKIQPANYERNRQFSAIIQEKVHYQSH